jgi:capsular exopolysaccharide synthesis family protein
MSSADPNPNSPVPSPARGRGVVPARPRREAPAARPPALVAAPNASGLLRALRRRWLLASVLGVLLAAAAGAGVWFFLPPPKNTASVLLHINSDEKGPSGFAHPEHIGNLANYQATQAALVKSRMVLNAALSDPKSPRAMQVARDYAVRTNLDPVEWLEREVKVDYGLAPEIMRISVSGDDVEDLKVLADAVAEAYLVKIVDAQTQLRQLRLRDLRNVQNTFQDKLRRSREMLRKLAEQNGVASPKAADMMALLLNEQLGEARRQLVTVQGEIRQLKTQLAVAAKGGKPAVPPKVVDALIQQDPGVQAHLARIARLQEQLEEHQKVVRDADHPLIRRSKNNLEAESKALEARKAEVRPKAEAKAHEQLREEGEFDAASLQQAIAVREELEKHCAEDVDRLAKKVKEAPGGAVGLRDIEFEQERIEDEIKTVAKSIERLEVELDAPARVRMHQPAVGYRVDAAARRAQLTAGAALAALALAAVAVALLEFFSRRVSSVEEVAHGLGVRVVGTVPACPARVRKLGDDSEAASYWQSLLTESVDAARTVLLHAARAEALKVVLVTSATGGEGKTSLSSHLAVSLARAGRKTLLVDCDLRNPSAHRLFNVPLGPGVSAVLRGEASAAEAVRGTGAAGLYMLPAGACDAEALGVLARDGVGPLFDALRGEFDFIVVDSSPVLPVADTLQVAQQADAVIFSVLRQVSRLPQVHEAYQRLAALGVRMFGAVVNGTSGDVYRGYGYNRKYLKAPQASNRAEE